MQLPAICAMMHVLMHSWLHDMDCWPTHHQLLAHHQPHKDPSMQSPTPIGTGANLLWVLIPVSSNQ